MKTCFLIGSMNWIAIGLKDASQIITIPKEKNKSLVRKKSIKGLKKSIKFKLYNKKAFNKLQ